MLSRCRNKKNPGYKNYGGRGIIVCERWKKFENFLEDMGDRPNRLTLERIDNNGNYCKENCKWATQKEQCNNQRTNVTIFYEGNKYHLSELSRIIGVSPSVIINRMKRNWDIKKRIPRGKQVKQIDLSDFEFSNDRENDIIKLRSLGSTMQQIGNNFGISRQRVKQILDKT